MSVVVESLEGRSLFSASPALVELRLDVATFKAELTAVKKSLTAEVKTLTADLKRVKASQASKTVLSKSLASSVTLPEAQLTKSLNTLVTKAAAFVPASTALSKKITTATQTRFNKTQAALDAAIDTENTLSLALSGTRLDTLSSTAVSLAAATGDATTAADANTLAGQVTTDNTSFASSQNVITGDLASLGAISVL